MDDFDPKPAPKKKTWLIILLAVGIPVTLGVLCCGGFGIFGYVMSKDILAATFKSQTFLNELGAKRVDEAYQLTSSAYQAKTSLVQFKEFIQKNPNLAGPFTATVSGVNVQDVNGAKKAYTNASIVSSAGSIVTTLTLAKENNDWKIDGFTVTSAP